jgi:MYXO-CTERM domain-containing protein
LFLTGTLQGNTKMALRQLERGCQNPYLPDARACRVLVEHYRGDPRGAPSSSQLARWTQRTYDLASGDRDNPFSLYVLGTLHRDGFGAVRDRDEAGKLFVAACEGYDPHGCMAAGEHFGVSGKAHDRQRALIYFQRACAAEVEPACDKAERLRSGQSLPLAAGKGQNGCACRTSGAPGPTGVLLVAGLLGLALRRRRRR